VSNTRTELVHACIDLIGVLKNIIKDKSELIKKKSDELSRRRGTDTTELISDR